MTTCQICGRPIKLVNGWITHHGYRQPWRRVGSGARTSSCEGARHLPYERSCNAIKPAIKHRVTARDYCIERLADLAQNPPAKLSYEGGVRRPDGEVERPEGFVAPGRPDYMPRSYVTLYHRVLNGLRTETAGLGQEITYLRQRLADWKPQEGDK